MREFDRPEVRELFYAALAARDARFDGRFWTGVRSTGVYCRPICPARPLQKNVVFFESPREAEAAGYRPCLRCRPEAAPLSAAWLGTSAVVRRALRFVEEVGLEGLDEESFAAKFGLSPRHLRRLFVAELGASPRAVYAARRLDLCRSLLAESGRPIAEIALAAGFGSLRRFNEAFKERYGRTPSEFRALHRSAGEDEGARRAGSAAGDGGCVARGADARGADADEGEARGAAAGDALVLGLSYRPPLDWEDLLRFLERHGLPGIEWREGDSWCRALPGPEAQAGTLGRAGGEGAGGGASGGGAAGGEGVVLRLSPDPASHRILARFSAWPGAGLYALLRAARRLLDLDADPLLVAGALGASPRLSELHGRWPGTRVPGAFEPFETAVGIILGQLVSTGRARDLGGELVARLGRPLGLPGRAAYAFPSPATLAAAELGFLKVPEARRRAIRSLAAELAAGRLALHPHQDQRELRARLLELPGIGPWTAELVAMRCLADPDAFPATDLVLRRALVAEGSGLDLERVAPYRAYAARLLMREHHDEGRTG